MEKKLIEQYDWSKLVPASELNKPSKKVNPPTYRPPKKQTDRVRRPRKNA
jgi:hypothetical protein